MADREREENKEGRLESNPEEPGHDEDGCQKIEWGHFEDTPNGQWQRQNFEYIESAIHGSLWQLPFRYCKWFVNHYAASYYAGTEEAARREEVR